MSEIEKHFGYGQARDQVSDQVDAMIDLSREVNLLSGRVELMMRLLSRIVAKIDPGYLDDPNDPSVQKRSKLLGDSVIEKMKTEALAQASSDPELFDKLKRYFKDVP
jgi:hypothetical protein